MGSGAPMAPVHVAVEAEDSAGRRAPAAPVVEAAVVKVEHYLKASSLIAQTTLRSVIGQAELDDLLTFCDELAARVRF